ncbi:hypothetical protein FRC09_005710 [Ceratobasidium sp. 395]|nr:hypothetical protein FRC09_005710 [Ceratobasidium sp. 395]
MPVQTPPPTRYIAIAGLCRVQGTHTPDEAFPNSRVVSCNFLFVDGRLVTIPVFAYLANCPDPVEDETAFCIGEFFFPPGEPEGWIQSTVFKVVGGANLNSSLSLTPPSISAVGEIATVMGRNWYLDVGVFDRKQGRILTFQIMVTVPDHGRFAKMQNPRVGSTMSVRGLLGYIAVNENYMTAIELEAVTFLNKLPALPSATDAVTLQGEAAKKTFPAKGVSKRKLYEAGLASGSPMKKFKSGPVEAFTPEELGSGPSSSQSLPSHPDSSVTPETESSGSE